MLNKQKKKLSFRAGKPAYGTDSFLFCFFMNSLLFRLL
ncbi:hypothetical protein QY97_00743 [Bacillus thermotolerans]|uniref:Uncharacterized protein n=1 Tax=Bacillus thermotolerans TaxID=1221996 RepID=A0A0F5I5I1_BACTR|nr:hypothetical protein QY97_00743 [Bacillus thermotolerans]KKB40407.1 hypothetical protein QY95_01402 [Bacillus thermotolerans]